MVSAEEAKNQPITATDLYEHWLCPHWQYFDVYGDPEKKHPRSRFAELLLDAGVLNEREIAGRLSLTPVPGRSLKERAKNTLALMQEGAEVIYQGVLMSGDLLGIPDMLEKNTGKSSSFGPYHYVPVDIKSAERLSEGHKFQLALYAEILAELQGLRPHEAFILNGYGTTMGFEVADFRQKLIVALEEIRSSRNGAPLPPFVSSGCKQSPWFDECLSYAQQHNDIALLYNIRESTMIKLREHGYRTIHDIAAMDTSQVAPTLGLTKKTLDRHKQQAEALESGKHVFRHKCIFPNTTCEIFFDIEGDPLRQVEYLFGFLVRDAAGERYVTFIAEKPEDEAKMWREFLEWTKTLPQDFSVYHYGNYEAVRLDILAGRYGIGGRLDIFATRLVDLAEVVKENVVLPLYFYSIKDIGNYIGYKRSKKIKSGGDSIGFYEDWITKGDREKLQAVIDYNEDDVIATRALKDWLDKGE